MRLLLDTHAFLWAASEPGKLGTRGRAVLKREENELFVSAVSAWEIATKARLGKLPRAEAVLRDFALIVRRLNAGDLPITPGHALLAGSYPQPHGDPFDRMLAAQAEIEGLILVSRDRALRKFGVEVLW